MTATRWQDWANVVVGFWLFISPWMLDYAGTAAARNACILGAGIVVVAIIAAAMPGAWQELINTLLGSWLVVSPFVLGFAATSAVALHTVVVGILVTAFAAWAMFAPRHLYRPWHGGHSA